MSAFDPAATDAAADDSASGTMEYTGDGNQMAPAASSSANTAQAVAAAPAAPVAAAASGSYDDEEEEEEEEVVEEASGSALAAAYTASGGATAASAAPSAASAAVPAPAASTAPAAAAVPHSMELDDERKEPEASAAAAASTSSSSAAATPAVSNYRSLLASQLRLLLNPFGPLNFTLALTTEPSIVPLPPASLYPAMPVRGAGGGGGGQAHMTAGHLSSMGIPSSHRKRGPEEMAQSADAFWAACKPLREPPLLRHGQHAPGLAYDPAHIAQSLAAAPAAANAVAAADGHLSNLPTLQRIVAAQAYLNSAEFAPGTDGFRSLWGAHEYFDPYRLLTHPPPLDQPLTAHPSPNDDLRLARFDAFNAQLHGNSRLQPLPLTSTLSFCSSHVFLSMCEVDLLHGLITSARQRDPDAIAHALRAPPPPQAMFLTFVDLSGAEGAAAEFVLWRRRVVNLRAKGWGYDVSGTGQPANWSANWSNNTAREQAMKNFDVFHAPLRGADTDAPPAVRAMSEENMQTFMRMIDMQTRGVGVQLAFALAHANPAAACELDQASLAYKPRAALRGPLLLFQVDLALRTLAKGGSLLLGVWDTHTPLTLSVLFLLFKCFEHVSLHQTAGTAGYGGGQTLVICRGYSHDRVAMRPSANPITAALIAARRALQQSAPEADWSSRALISAEEMRANPNFVMWVRRYNLVAHAYQLHCLLTLLQRTPTQPSVLDAADPPSEAASASPFHTLVPIAPPHHRIRITMMQYLGLPVTDSFAAAAAAQ